MTRLTEASIGACGHLAVRSRPAYAPRMLPRHRHKGSTSFATSSFATSIALCASIVSLALACGGSSEPAASESAAKAASEKGAADAGEEKPLADALAPDEGLELGGPEAAQKFIASLADESTRSASVLGLEPSHADYLAVYGETFGGAFESALKDSWTKHQIVPAPWGPDQTEVKLSRATSEDFKAWEGEAPRFPRGYKRVAEHMQPGHVFYQFRFLKPGQGAGSNWDGLVWVGGAWKLFPKPYAILPEEG